MPLQQKVSMPWSLPAAKLRRQGRFFGLLVLFSQVRPPLAVAAPPTTMATDDEGSALLPKFPGETYASAVSTRKLATVSGLAYTALSSFYSSTNGPNWPYSSTYARKWMSGDPCTTSW